MKRRTVLRRTGALLAAGTVAGCVGGSGDGDSGDGSGSTADDTATDTSTRTATPTATSTPTRTATGTPTGTPTATPDPPERTPHPGSAPLAPGVLERTVTDEGSCRSEDGTDASVAFEDGTVVVTGHFSTPVPCYTVDVTESGYGGGTYAVSLVPERMGTEDDPVVCPQCLGRVDYEARIRFETPPGTVVVRHGGEVVARADR